MSQGDKFQTSFCFLKTFAWVKSKWFVVYFDCPQLVSLEKFLGIVFPPHFFYDISRKMTLILYSSNWPNFIVWLPLPLEIFSNTCIAIVDQPACGAISFEINLIFLIKPFLLVTKQSRQKFEYLSSFLKGQKLSQTWECTFKYI